MESHTSTSPSFYNNEKTTPTEIQIQPVRSDEPVMSHLNGSSATQNDLESSPDSSPCIVLKGPAESNALLENATEPQLQSAGDFFRAIICQQGTSNTQAPSSYHRENGNNGHIIASSSHPEALLRTYKIRNGTCSIADSATAMNTVESHGEQDLRRPTHVTPEKGSGHPDEPSPAYPLVTQQQSSSNDGKVVSEMQSNADVDRNSSTPVFQNSVSESKVRLPMQRWRYRWPPGVKKKFHCSECSDFFCTRGNRDRHLLKCHPRNRLHFRCENCSASYGTRTGKTIHIRRVHPDKGIKIPRGHAKVRKVNGRLRFFCHYQGCEKNYTELCSVYRHVEMDHVKIRYRCECGYAATTRYNLQVHQNRHSSCS